MAAVKNLSILDKVAEIHSELHLSWGDSCTWLRAGTCCVIWEKVEPVRLKEMDWSSVVLMLPPVVTSLLFFLL